MAAQVDNQDLQHGAPYSRIRTRSLIEPDRRPCCLVRAEAGDASRLAPIAGATGARARGMGNGVGCVYIDPYGAGRLFASNGWCPSRCERYATFSFDNSMSFLAQLLQPQRRRLVLVDGAHDFDSSLRSGNVRRLLRLGGIIVIDDAQPAGPFGATKSFLADHPQWRELGDSSPRSNIGESVRRSASLRFRTAANMQAPPYFTVEGDHFVVGSAGHRRQKRIRRFVLAAATGAGSPCTRSSKRSAPGQPGRDQDPRHSTFRVRRSARTFDETARPLIAVSEQADRFHRGNRVVLVQRRCAEAARARPIVPREPRG